MVPLWKQRSAKAAKQTVMVYSINKTKISNYIPKNKIQGNKITQWKGSELQTTGQDVTQKERKQRQKSKTSWIDYMAHLHMTRVAGGSILVDIG